MSPVANLPISVGGCVAALVRERETTAYNEHEVRSRISVPQGRLSGRECEVVQHGVGSVRLD